MSERLFDVQLLLPDGQTWWTICVCDTEEILLAVVKSLLATGKGCPGEIKIIVRPYC